MCGPCVFAGASATVLHAATPVGHHHTRVLCTAGPRLFIKPAHDQKSQKKPETQKSTKSKNSKPKIIIIIFCCSLFFDRPKFNSLFFLQLVNCGCCELWVGCVYECECECACVHVLSSATFSLIVSFAAWRPETTPADLHS